MRILFVSHSSGAGEGSVKALLSIVSELKHQGHEIYIVFPEDGNAIEKVRAIDVHVVITKFYNSIVPKYTTLKSQIAVPYKVVRNTCQNFITVKRLISLIHDFNIDLVHTNVGTVNVGFYAARYCHVPHVWHIREMAEKIFLWHPLPSISYKKRLFRKNSYNIAITHEVKSFYQLSDSNSKVIYDGVFKATSVPQIDLNKDNYLLFVGRICEGKGTAWAVDAFLRVKDAFPEMQLLIVGTGNNAYARDLMDRCKEYVDSGRIKFLGYRDDVYDLMQKATALIVPSELEGFGFITAEAMYNGCMVIGRNTGGTKEQFDNGVRLVGDEIGLRFSTIDELVAQMDTVCRNGIKRYERMLSQAQKTVVTLYSIEKNAENILDIYHKLLK